MLYPILWVGGLIVLALLFWPTLKKWLPLAWSGTATEYIDKASHSSTDAILIAAEQAMLIAGWEADDTTYMELVRAIRERRRSWAIPVFPPNPVATPSIATLAADVAILRAVVASQTTSTIPPSAVNNG